MSDNMVIGLDVGGTSTRVLITDLDGVPVSTGRAGGANPTSHGPEAAAVELRKALAQALDGLDPLRVRAGTIGLAGVGKLTSNPAAMRAFDDAWHSSGLRCRYELVGDALVAYASGTQAPDGTVLIAGTGATAAAVRRLRLHRVADAHGWLLGDNGSGFWLGLQAARHALAVQDGAVPDGPLARAVRAHVLGPRYSTVDARQVASDLVQAINSQPPVTLAELAPVVFTASAHDPAATRIVTDAAAHLVTTAALVHEEGLPVVLAGGMLTAATPLAEAVRTLIRERWPTAEPVVAGDGAAAAARLAALRFSHAI